MGQGTRRAYDMSCLCEADGSCLMTHDPYDVEHGSAFLWSGSLFWTLWINKNGPSTHWKREKDTGKGVCARIGKAVQCYAMLCYATRPFPTTSRETQPTRLFARLVRVAGEDEYFKIKARLLQVLLYPLFHTCNFSFFFASFFLSYQSRGLLLSSSNGSIRQYKHKFLTVQMLIPILEQSFR